MRKKAITAFVWLILGAMILPDAGRAETFFGEARTGMMELTGFNYPVYLYVPESYQPTQPYPLLISLPAENEKPDAHVEKWKAFAKRKSLILLVPSLTLSRSDKDVPDRVDTWLIRLKKEVMNRYRISDERIFLVGQGGAAHYAAYLGLRYPQEFSGVALLGGAWNGPLEKLVNPSSRPRKQIPFFVSLEPGMPAPDFEAVEAHALKLTEKGYPVYMERLEPGEEFGLQDFRKRMYGWLEDKADRWYDVIRGSEKSPKEKLALWAKGFFKVN